MKLRKPPKKPIRGAQVGKLLPWLLIRWDMTQQGHVRRMRATHLPTGVAVESGGESIAWSRLRRTILPELALRVARKLGHEEPRTKPPTATALWNAEKRTRRDVARRNLLRAMGVPDSAAAPTETDGDL